MGGWRVVTGAGAEVLELDAAFLRSCATRLTLGELLSSLAELIHDPTAANLAHDVWSDLFPQAPRLSRL